VFGKMVVECSVTGDVHGDAKRVTCFATHLSEVETWNADCVVGDDLIVIPAGMTAQRTIICLHPSPIFL